MQKRENKTICHALNGGEYQIPLTKYRADGYCKATNTIYSFQGCHWHGHPKCQKSKLNNESALVVPSAMLYAMTVDRAVTLKKLGYKIVEKWECDFDREIKNLNIDDQNFLKQLDWVDR